MLMRNTPTAIAAAIALSGFAKNATERSEAERIARNANGVRSVRNDILVRP